MTSNDFNWNPSGDDGHDIVVRHQPAIAVYLNPHGEIVIRQQDEYDQDHYVYVTKDNVSKVAERMQELAEIAGAPAQLAPSKGAERQRRYRQRHHRNGVTPVQHVTEDGADSALALRLVAAE